MAVQPKTLLFFANEESQTLVNDYEALDNKMCRYIGRRWSKEDSGFVVSDEPSVVQVTPKYKNEYIVAARRREIIPANKETADFCCVGNYMTKFDR